MDNQALSANLQQHAYAVTMAISTLVEAMGMQAANAQQPNDQPFTKKDFDDLILRNGCHHNAVLSLQWQY